MSQSKVTSPEPLSLRSRHFVVGPNMRTGGVWLRQFGSPQRIHIEMNQQISCGIATKLKEGFLGLEKSPRSDIKSGFERSVRDAGKE